MKRKIIMLFIVALLSVATVVASGWCEGTDKNFDGVVDYMDYRFFMDSYGSVCTGLNQFCWGMDYDHSGVQDLPDFVFFANHYGMTGCGTNGK